MPCNWVPSAGEIAQSGVNELRQIVTRLSAEMDLLTAVACSLVRNLDEETRQELISGDRNFRQWWSNHRKRDEWRRRKGVQG